MSVLATLVHGFAYLCMYMNTSTASSLSYFVSASFSLPPPLQAQCCSLRWLPLEALAPSMLSKGSQGVLPAAGHVGGGGGGGACQDTILENDVVKELLIVQIVGMRFTELYDF